MTTYTTVKTWQMLVNTAGAHYTTKLAADQDVGFFALQFLTGALGFKDRAGAAIGSPAGLYVVDCSSDSVSASNWGSNTNYIVSYDKIVHAAGAHSWFVLRSTASFGGLGYPLYWLFEATGTSAAPSWTIQPGKTPGSNGNITTAPTMTNTPTAATGQTFVTGAVQQKMHGQLSTDGHFMIVVGGIGTLFAKVGIGAWSISLADIVPGDGFPWFGFVSTTGTTPMGFPGSATNLLALFPAGGAATYTLPNIASGLLDSGGMGAGGDAADHSLPRFPYYVVNFNGALTCSLRGRVDDLFLAPIIAAAANGMVLPVAGDPEIQDVGGFWLWLPAQAMTF